MGNRKMRFARSLHRTQSFCNGRAEQSRQNRMFQRQGPSFPGREACRRGGHQKWEWISNNNYSSNWLVGNSQMAKFHATCGDYQIVYKREGKLMEIIEEAEWLVSKKKATHVLIDGIQNSVPEIMRVHLKLEKQVLQRLKVLNESAVVVLEEVM